MLVDVDALQIVLTPQTLFANAAQVGDRPRRARGCAGDEQPQDVVRSLGSLNGERLAHGGAMLRRSSPTSTRSMSDKLPMIRFSGSGRRRTSVGTARI